jgi:DnaJ-domain-containing protein 1
MFDSQKPKKQRLKVTVRLVMSDGSEQNCYLFVAPGSRVSDTLNDERPFMPLERMDGTISIIHKSCIQKVDPVESLTATTSNNPFDILGIDEDASDQQIHDAYRRAVAQVHPDRVQTMGLPKEFLDLANKRAALMNEAFAKIKRQRAAGKSEFGT